MIDRKIKYSYNDISIVPETCSDIEHRDECNVFIDGKLPLFTAPMASVIDENNFNIFENNGINGILPRTVSLETRKKYSFNNKWAAFSLSEFENIFCIKNEEISDGSHMKVLIDIANGHMKKLFDLVIDSKKIYSSNIEIMIGNIANPQTYRMACLCGADYVRLGIGAGSGCITSSNTSIHFGMASLIEETIEVKKELLQIGFITEENCTKIVADGGVKNYSDIIKALALGADYVMIGGLFSKMLESAGETFLVNEDEIVNQYDEDTKEYFKTIKNTTKDKLYKKFFGMSTKKAQILCGKDVLKTSEGVEKIFEVEYTIDGWVDNFKDYLKSAMSYTNSRDLENFKNCHIILISNNTYNSINK